MSCSWVERFVVFNKSTNSILVNYTLSTNQNELPIFDNHIQCFELKNNKEIDWNKEVILIDKDSSSLSFSFDIPQNSAFIFGSLHNDSYEKFNTKFINGYRFNLTKMEIIEQYQTVSIMPETFDDFFKKKRGIISYAVK
jgi:hypothetical protein